jgi:transcriptional regulator with XRE-family HTH domain
MHLPELGSIIRKARRAKGTTQEALAKRIDLSRTTVNQLENGVVPDLGIRKVQALLEDLGLDLHVRPLPRRPNYVRMALGSANSSYREKLTEGELTRALISGHIPRGRRPHLRTLFEEAPPSVLRGVVHEIGKYMGHDRVRRNTLVIAEALGALRTVKACLEER